MASVFVVDSSFRRTQSKVTPSTYLREVLEDACKSRKLQPEEYALKTHTNKIVDLSQPFRLSGLTAGAKLQLVQSSRSPSVVSVAVQLPVEQGSTRLSDKFASNTSLWAVLRRFEEGAAGRSSNRLNITQQGVPSSSTGSGRLLYRQPCLNAMGRMLDTFTDLQKTLSQLGFSSGSVLMRLSYKDSDTPLEQAMMQMSAYFDSDSPGQAKAETAPVPAADAAPTEAIPAQAAAMPRPTASVNDQEAPTQSTANVQPAETASATQPLNHISVYHAPKSTTPAAASQDIDDSAYEPTVDDARALQASLQKAGRNTRLLSDKEIADQEAERQARLGTVRKVDIRVRYPDQTMIETAVDASESAADLYSRVRNTLQYPTEAFELRYLGLRGHQTLPDDPGKKVVKDLAFRGKMLLTLVWLPSASNAARTSPALKDELRTQARELKVELMAEARGADAAPHPPAAPAKEQKSEKSGKVDIEAKMKKFLGFGKK